MKKIDYIVLAMGAMLMGACSDDPEYDRPSDLYKSNCDGITFSADMQSPTDELSKTYISGTSVMFSGNEVVGISNGDNEVCGFNNTITSGGASASFSGTITPSTDKYYAIMPLSTSTTFSDGYFTTSIPTTQRPTSGSVDPASQLMTAVCDFESLKFKFLNVCSYVKFTTTQCYKSVKFETNKEENVAGGISVRAEDASDLKFTDGSSSVTLEPKSGVIEPGTYYLAVAPCVAEGGFTLTFTDTKGEAHVKVSSKSATFSRAKFKNLGTISFSTPLELTALEDGAYVYYFNRDKNNPDLWYSTDGENWTEMKNGQSKGVSLSAGESVYLKGVNPTGVSISKEKYSTIMTTGKVAVSGNIMSLVYGSDYETNCGTIPSANCFTRLFEGASITSAPELPATTLGKACYALMFKDCKNITKAPKLPATTLTDSCYTQMFDGCTSLTEPSALPATTLTSRCYRNMFNGCTSLTTAPNLPATVLEENSYSGMFNGCTSLNYVEVSLTKWTTGNSFEWLKNVSATGTFVQPQGIVCTAGRNSNHIPEGWTVVEK